MHPSVMKNNSPLEIYALVICAFSLLSLAAGTASAIYQSVRISAPNITVSSDEYRRISSNENFVEQEHDPNKREFLQKLSDEKITAVRMAFGETALLIERRSGKQELTKDSLIMLVMLFLLAIHVRLLRRTRVTNRGG